MHVSQNFKFNVNSKLTCEDCHIKLSIVTLSDFRYDPFVEWIQKPQNNFSDNPSGWNQKNSIRPEYQVHINVEYILSVDIIGLVTLDRKQDNDITMPPTVSRVKL